MVVVLNYARQGMLREAMQGSVGSLLARYCPVPLVLLQPPQMA
jgi:nucleotide-binding universal stress UspA family protein